MHASPAGTWRASSAMQQVGPLFGDLQACPRPGFHSRACEGYSDACMTPASAYDRGHQTARNLGQRSQRSHRYSCKLFAAF
jgi:hypothetical protein